MSAQTRFLSVSGNRCGSTWLEFMLNQLPGVRTDFEFQWVSTPPSELHVAMDQPGFDIDRAFGRISPTTPHVGSKLVFPGQNPAWSATDQAGLRRVLAPDIRIIHVSRSYKDAYLSWRRGSGHVKNTQCEIQTTGIQKWLWSEYQDTFFSETRPIALDLDECRRNFEHRLIAEKFYCSLAQSHRYYQVRYENIGKEFKQILDFLDIAYQDQVINRLVNNPPTQKLPRMDYQRAVTNFDAYLDLAGSYDAQRLELLN
ncbi:MAG: sulfotransferase domain-containing protein [Candidatus Sericytochromatia bacterium]